MSIHVALQHVTEYHYDRRINLGPQIIRLRPCEHSRTRILSYSLRVGPETPFLNWQQDALGNYQARVMFSGKTDTFRVEVDLIAEMSVQNPFDFFLEPAAERLPFNYSEDTLLELAPYRVLDSQGASVVDYLEPWLHRSAPTVDFLVDLNQAVARDVSYIIRLEPGVQSPEETLASGKGSCRDSAWLMVHLLRHLGLAARFVSGYLIQLKADVAPLEGPGGPAQDFTDLHAWCEVYLPGAGWVGLDPTSGLLAGEGHIPLACSPSPQSAAPVSGTVEQSETRLVHSMTIQRIHESPRVTLPYQETVWQDILAVGDVVEQRLQAGDVRLTMGGEPTFVSRDDPDAEEWNTAALGPTKRLRALDLFYRMAARYAPQGLLHLGQGKWYPGEPLPRWSLNCYWRKDGQPLWNDHKLYADERQPGLSTVDSAQAFIQQLAGFLGVDPFAAFAAYEDALYYLWRERQLPANVDIAEARLDDPVERARLAHLFEQGLGQAVGWVLPLGCIKGEWITGPWFLRRERCQLLPGDSPMGYRLPLEGLPWVRATDFPWIHPIDPSVRPKALAQYPLYQRPNPAHRASAGSPAGSSAGSSDGVKAHGWQPDDVLRTALCVEPRQGHLHVFMPPVQRLEDYLALVEVVEQTCSALQTRVILEGYEPPHDSRLQSLRLTPDPGVLEVNIHPVDSWRGLVEQTTHLYDMAHLSQLQSEKFMLDGRHSGTGGGNHLVLGAARPEDSPFFRRPDLLQSMLSFWQHHPSLSYLFSGLFIGPTSQAPRVDEARHESLQELELAFAALQSHHGPVLPWMTDRILRNILTDVTGNTHRTEFCIDKLFNPDSSQGRLGLLEMRAFEMPPHPRMALVQQLLVRGLLLRFWETPYTPERLVRWGTQLHDRMMLPHYLWQDFGEVIEVLQRAGLPFTTDWFAPHFAFRFPLLGEFTSRGITVELRQALEPWPVLGEEGAAGGTVRYVDSSLERLQVKLSGMTDGRYQLLANGYPVPLQASGIAGEQVAGVRYRAWRPASALHPTIGVNTPLVFDLYDTWTGRAIGGCQYHVMHPGGRNYVTFPVNAFEAESRRLERFFRLGHTPGTFSVGNSVIQNDTPATLDLRFAHNPLR